MFGGSRATANRHAPGLDGIRGVAVAAITAYHLGFINGGLLSVSVFFTLSGYLITSILLAGFERGGTIDLKSFWLRRARRLLPALFMLLLVVLYATAIARPSQLASYARQALSATLYIANWATIVRGDTYFNRFTGPGPLDHLWSLAIEEQFYVVWPVLLLALLLAAPRGRGVAASGSAARKVPLIIVLLTALLALSSAMAMASLYAPSGANNTRAYEGTDARAAPILIGALTAMLMPLGEITRMRADARGIVRSRIGLELMGALATMVVAIVVLATDEHAPFLYRGGESLVAIASAALIIAAAHPATFVGRAFGFGPLRWLGVRTYGVYLWHLPVVAFTPASVLARHPWARGLLQTAIIVGLAALSWTLLEDPIRRRGFVAPFVNDTGLRVTRRWAGAIVYALFATAALAAWPLLSAASAKGHDLEAEIAELASETPDPRPRELAVVQAVSLAVPDAKPSFTACKQVVHVGDSASLGLMSRRYLPPEERLDAQYQAVGVKLFVAEISGGRSIVEKFNDHPSAYEIVAAREGGYNGCWVFAVGMGDAATIRGNVPGLEKRIGWMMSAAEGARVLWVTTKTLLDKGPYQNLYMESFNRTLFAACARYPNMRVYDWASEAEEGWYLEDKIHPNEIGSRERAARLARALAVAFPQEGPSGAECVVRSSR